MLEFGVAPPGSSALLAAAFTGLAVAAAMRRTVPGALPDQGRGRPPPARQARALLGPRSASLIAGLAVLLVVGGPLGVVLGVLVASVLPRQLSQLESAATAAYRRRLTADLPLALDLLAGCLAGGASPGAAALAVGTAVQGPCGDRLAMVAAALTVGSPAEEAWARLAGPGRPTGADPLAGAALALSRAAQGGAPVAAAMSRLAAASRADARLRGQAAVRRAGVVAVAPLGLCFLPAFALLGVVPVIVGLAGSVLTDL